MSTLMERLAATPQRVAGPPDWFAQLSPDHQREIRGILAARLRDDGTVQHSMLQLAEILIEHYGLQVKGATVRYRLAQLTREIQRCAKPSRKK